jgi:protein TonB
MRASTTGRNPVPLALAATIAVNAILFAGLPLLTRVAEREKPQGFDSPIMIAYVKPPKPPEELKQRELRERQLKKMEKRHTKTRSARPKMDVSQFEFATDMGGGGIGVRVGSLSGLRQFKNELQSMEFELSEVDTPPRVVRKAPAVFPFAAKRKGLQGRVVVRCLISIQGNPGKMRIVQSEPEGVFDEAALQAVERWRFKPGILAGEPVPTWVRIPFKFELE